MSSSDKFLPPVIDKDAGYDAIPDDLEKATVARRYAIQDRGIIEVVVLRSEKECYWLPAIAITWDKTDNEDIAPLSLMPCDNLALDDVEEAWSRNGSSRFGEVLSLMSDSSTTVLPDPQGFVEFVRGLPGGEGMPMPDLINQVQKITPQLFGDPAVGQMNTG